ncbi:hypothetical protein [Spirillospora sp. CA-128828]|uniref:hypothetical protein n=1 Tax=Spirillospora sp. CA-128828 TaxID=3240033 RepID=UPI003D94B824
MDKLQFIDAMTGHLVWPIVVVVLAMVFRSPLGRAIDRLKKLSWGDRVVELSESVDSLQEAAAAGQWDLSQQDAVEKTIQKAVNLGYISGRDKVLGVPRVRVEWPDGQPRLTVEVSEEMPMPIKAKKTKIVGTARDTVRNDTGDQGDLA